MTDLQARRDDLTQRLIAATERLQSLDGSRNPTEALEIVSDIIALAVPLQDSLMAAMGLSGASWSEVCDTAGMTAQQVSRRVASTPELSEYATVNGTGARRVSRDALAIAREDLRYERLRTDPTMPTKRIRRVGGRSR